MSYQITSAILGLCLATIILWLIRRDRLHSRHGFWWLVVALGVMVLGVFPTFIDKLAVFFGVSYPPTLLFILGMGMILIKVINMDLHQSNLERKIRSLAQRMAILEGEKQDEDL